MNYTLIALLSFFANLACCFVQPPDNGFLKKDYSLGKPYSGNGMTIPNWDFRDHVMITNNFIRLTQDTQGQKGSIWSKVPCTFHDWEIHVQFKIHGSGRTIAADGMAFWYTREKMVPGSVFGSKDQFKGLGLFLDTYKNGNQPISFPQVSAMIGNGSLKYDHDNDNKETSIGSCLTSFRNKLHDTYMKIRYYKEELSVQFDVRDDGEWKDCMRISGVKLPTNYFFGFSAATGDLADNHEIISVKTYELKADRSKEETEDWSLVSPGLLKPAMDNRGDSDAYKNSSVGGFKTFFLIIVGLGVVAFIFYVIYQKNQETSRKHFY